MISKSEISGRTSVHLDLIRGVAAIAVMLGHVRGLFFVDFPELARPSIINRVLYGITGLGHQAVMVFFVLSGYFIGTSVWAAMEARRWSWGSYLVNRLTRLQLVLLPALILGAVWDQIGMRLPQAASFYYGGLYKYYAPSVALRSTIPIFLGNLTFLQSIVSPVFGSNGPLWSLSYEFWYYMLFPLLMLGAVAWKGYRERVIYIALALLLFWFIGPTISIYFLLWLAGAVVGRLRHSEKPWSPRELPALAIAGAALFAGVLAWNRVRPLSSEMLSDGIIGICFAIWLFVLIHGARQDVSPLYARGAKTLAGFSYTLYLTHFPALLLLRALLDPEGNWTPDVLHFLYAMTIAVGVLGFAYFVAEGTEVQTAAVRRRIMQPWAPRAKEVAR